MRILFLILLCTLTSSVFAQSPMELNRSGRWAEASDVAGRIVADETLSLRERCEAYYSLIYAELQLGRFENAADHLTAFDRTCAEAVAESWIEREVDRLRVQLAPPAPSTDDDWKVAEDPATTGLDATALAEHETLCERSAADACLVVHDAHIVQEYYGRGYHEPMMAMSSTKSITGLLTGMLIGDGKLALDDSVAKYIPEWEAGAEAGITVHHLLTMTSGLLSSHVPRPQDSHVGGVSNKDSLVFGLPLVAEPGTEWAYSNEGVYLLSPLLDHAAGEPIEAYARHRLFEPLGMTNTRFRVIPQGQAWTHADLETTPRDLARIGQLMLQRGRWNGEQIVPEAWIEASVQPSQNFNSDYGLLWWLDVPGGFAARGAYNTNVYVLPDRNLVVVRMQGGPREEAAPYEPAAFELFKRLVSE